MYSRELARQEQQLRELISRTQAASANELELQAHWGRYLCVLVAGFLENAIGEVYAEFARRSGNREVASYVASNVLRIQNPKAERFVTTARAFSESWADSLEVFLSEDGRKDAIDSIMNNRHQIAHGKSVGVSVVRVADYLGRCISVVNCLEQQCGFQESY